MPLSHHLPHVTLLFYHSPSISLTPFFLLLFHLPLIPFTSHHCISSCLILLSLLHHPSISSYLIPPSLLQPYSIFLFHPILLSSAFYIPHVFRKFRQAFLLKRNRAMAKKRCRSYFSCKKIKYNLYRIFSCELQRMKNYTRICYSMKTIYVFHIFH